MYILTHTQFYKYVVDVCVHAKNVLTYFSFCVFFSIFRYTNNLGEAKKIGIKKAITSQLAVGIMFFIIYASYALGFWYGTTLVLSGNEYTVGRIMLVSFTF